MFSVLLYASETWTLKKADVNKLTAFEMMWYHRILKIEWFHHVTHDEVRHCTEAWSTIIQQIKRHKLSVFCHICWIRDDHLIKLIMQSHIKGRTKQGRLRHRQTYNIVDWCGKELHKTRKLAWREGRWLVDWDMAPMGLQAHGDWLIDLKREIFRYPFEWILIALAYIPNLCVSWLHIM